jgi:hypothetical protein
MCFNFFRKPEPPKEPNTTLVYDYFQKLHQEPYTEHPNSNINPDVILTDNEGSDCEDRTNALLKKMRENNYTGLAVLHLQGHQAALSDGMVYDATSKDGDWKMPLKDYLEKYHFGENYSITPY